MKCSKCENELKDNMTFCPNCGTIVSKQNKNGMPFWKAFILVVGIAILIIAGIVLGADFITHQHYKSGEEYVRETVKEY